MSIKITTPILECGPKEAIEVGIARLALIAE
jgi:hypothetical protein